MRKQAKDIKPGENINIAGQTCKILNTEISEIGKHGKRKVRIEAETERGEKIIIIRPEDYPFDSA